MKLTAVSSNSFDWQLPKHQYRAAWCLELAPIMVDYITSSRHFHKTFEGSFVSSYLIETTTFGVENHSSLSPKQFQPKKFTFMHCFDSFLSMIAKDSTRPSPLRLSLFQLGLFTGPMSAVFLGQSWWFHRASPSNSNPCQFLQVCYSKVKWEEERRKKKGCLIHSSNYPVKKAAFSKAFSDWSRGPTGDLSRWQSQFCYFYSRGTDWGRPLAEVILTALYIEM